MSMGDDSGGIGNGDVAESFALLTVHIRRPRAAPTEDEESEVDDGEAKTKSDAWKIHVLAGVLAVLMVGSVGATVYYVFRKVRGHVWREGRGSEGSLGPFALL